MKVSFYYFLAIFIVITVQGCETKEETAAKKALNSAEQGAAIGQFRLGKMFAKGEGVEQDNTYAYMWVNAAVMQGLGDSASDFKNELETKMTQAEIKNAENLYIKCKEKSFNDC